MGNVLITRRGGSSNSGGNIDTTFNYVTPDYSSFFINNDSTQEYHKLYTESATLSFTSGESLSIEYFLKPIDINAQNHERYLEFNSMSSTSGILLSNYKKDTTRYLQFAMKNTYIVDADYDYTAPITYGTPFTASVVIGPANIKFYQNGSLRTTKTDYNNSFIPTESVTSISIMRGSSENQSSDGIFYGFRIYHKALTDTEIVQNYREDLKYINFVNSFYN